jgi:hypothetical protein
MSTKLEEKVHRLETVVAILEKSIPEMNAGIKDIKKILEGEDGLVTQNVVNKSSIKKLYWFDFVLIVPIFLMCVKDFIL